jgi:hypothetical protein
MIRLIVFIIITCLSCKAKQNISREFNSKREVVYKKYNYIEKLDKGCNNWNDLKLGEDKERIENIIGAPHSYELVDLFYRCFYNDGTIVYTHNNNVISINSPKCNINISKMDSFKQKACQSWSIIKSGMPYSEVIKILGESNGSQNYGYSTTYFYGKNSITCNNSNVVISIYGPECYK